MAQIGRSFPAHALLSARQILAARTRFYFPSTGAGAVSPAFDAGWEDVSIVTRLKTVTTKIASAMTTVAFSDLLATDEDILFRQWVSDPLVAQTIIGQTLTMQMRAIETLATNNMFVTWVVKVVSNDGGTVRGTLVAITRDNVEVDAATLTNRSLVLATNALAILDGDRLVFEIGTGGVATVSHDSSLRIGDADATDLPVNDTTTTDNSPWLEFQQVLVFQAATVDIFRILRPSSFSGLGSGGPFYHDPLASFREQRATL